MSSTPSDPIRYADLVCLITGHDAEWSRRHSYAATDDSAVTLDGSFNRVFDEVERICSKYRNSINEYARQAYAVEPKDEVPNYLFRPLKYLPIGHADALTITLFDDLDPIHSLTAQCSTTVEEVAVGFAPIMSSLGADSWPLEWRYCAVNIEQFFLEADLPPLLLIGRLKLAAIGMLGQSLDYQTAVFRSILENTLAALISLDLRCPENADETTEFDISKNSLRKTRITLLDLQGQEEVGLLVASENYSIAAAILSRIQGITLKHLESVDPLMMKRIGSQDWLSASSRLFQDLSDAGDAPAKKAGVELEDIVHSHALRWTRTTLAVSQTAFREPSPASVKGFIDLVSQTHIAVGHQQAVDDTVRTVADEIKRLDETTPARTPPSQYWSQLMGHADLLIHQSQMQANSDRLILTAEAISRVKMFINQSVEHGPSTAVQMRNLVGLSSLPTIPLPPYEELRFELKDHKPLLQTLLPVIRWRMVSPEMAADPDDRKRIKARQRISGEMINRHGFCPFTLCEEPKKYLAPSSLARSVQYLFQNYTTVLSNPFVFDTVIDLYDCFASFYAVLTKHLVEVFGPQMKSKKVHSIRFLLKS